MKRSCTSGCGCLLIFFIGFLVLLKFAIQPNVMRIKEVPDDFPKAIPVYDTDAIRSITFVDGKERGKALEFVGYVPKAILAPMITFLRVEIPSQAPGVDDNRMDNLSSFFETNLADHRNVVTIAWRDMLADPDFVLQFYETELRNHRFAITAKTDSDRLKQFDFSNETINIAGSFSLTDAADTRGTDRAVLTVYY